MTADEKYVVLFDRRAITKKARRGDAHRVVRLLGSQYRVWNTVTRNYSTN